MVKSFKVEQLDVNIYNSRVEMGEAAAESAANAIRHILAEKEFANVIFAAAPSQNEMLAALCQKDIDFSRVNAFHMDEYAGLGIGDEQSFASYLNAHIFSVVPFHKVHYIPAKLDVDSACCAYAELLTEYPPDVVCMGIGENGHIAFNDPPVADFNDPYIIKNVALDPVCRMQQVHDGCFPTIDDVPEYALTLTVPALLSARHLICTVPGIAKAKAVSAMLYGPYGEVCPATSLRRHKGARMFLDKDSAKEVLQNEI